MSGSNIARAVLEAAERADRGEFADHDAMVDWAMARVEELEAEEEKPSRKS